MEKRLFTSESVTEGHPDKMCDAISDAILDAILAQDPNGRVACECTVTTGVVNVMGEITTDCYVDIPKVVRQTVREIGEHIDAVWGSLDTVILNAGTYSPLRAWDLTADNARHTVHTNLLGVVDGVAAVVPQLLRQPISGAAAASLGINLSLLTSQAGHA